MTDHDIAKWTMVGTCFGAFGTISAVGMVLFGDKIKSLFYHPELCIAVYSQSPYIQKMGVSPKEACGGEQATFFRVHVENLQNTPAENVEVWITTLHKLAGNEEQDQKLIPIPLRWTHTGGRDHKDQQIMGYIGKDSMAMIDFGILPDPLVKERPLANIQNPPNANFSFLSVPGYSPLLDEGQYIATIQINAKNSPPKKFRLRFGVIRDRGLPQNTIIEQVNLRLI